MALRAWCLTFLLLTPRPAAASDQPIRLVEDFVPGYQYHVSCRSEITGQLTLPPSKNQTTNQPLAIEGQGVIEYGERVLNRSPDGQVEKTFRVCQKMDFRRKVGNQPQESGLRPAVRR